MSNLSEYNSKLTPLYRLYNPNTGDHHYTVDENEYNVLETQGWIQEGISCIVRALSNGASYLFPEGVHDFTGKVTFSKGVSIRGEGVDLTTLLFHGDSSGIEISPEKNGPQVTIKDLTIDHEVDFSKPTNQTALKVDLSSQIENGSIMNRVSPRIKISNVHIKGQWTDGIHIVNAHHTVIDNVHITGQLTDSGVRLSDSCLKFSGNANGTEVQIKDSWMFFSKKGIDISGTLEGAICSGLTIVATTRGIQWISTGHKPHLSLTNSHLNNQSHGVYTSAVHQTFIRGNLFYKNDVNGQYTGIRLYDSNDHIVTDNVFKSLGGDQAKNTSIKVESCGNYIITGNVLSTPIIQLNERDTNIVKDNVIGGA